MESSAGFHGGDVLLPCLDEDAFESALPSCLALASSELLLLLPLLLGSSGVAPLLLLVALALENIAAHNVKISTRAAGHC